VNDRDAVLAAAASVEGWMTPAQGERLWAAAAAVPPPGIVVEIGSYRGKPTAVPAAAAADGVSVVAIDPHAGNDRGPREIEGRPDEGEADHEAFRANLVRAGVEARVRHLRRFSNDALGEITDPIDVLYIDGAHRFGPAHDDLVRWGAKLRPGGTMLVHDAYSSVGVTLALLSTTVAGRSFRYLGRDGSLTRYRREDLPLAWFARNVAIKALIVLGLGRFARALGHDGETWPY